MRRFFLSYISFFVLSVWLTGCSIFHLLSVREPQSEEVKEANSSLLRYAIDTSFSFQLSSQYRDSLSEKKYMLNTYKYEKGGKASSVQIRLYTNTGEFIYGWEQCFGNLHKLGILDSLPMKQKSWLPVNKNLSFQQDLHLFNITSQEKEALLRQIGNYDYVMVLFWANWTGWYSKDMLKRVKQYLKEHPEAKILLITLNTAP